MRRAGYTYIEMLVVVTVIGILVALLLPAVQACREAARRSKCSHTLRQLIIAVQNYELHHSVLPPGTIDSQRPILSQPSGYHHNWITQILPFVEQNSPYRHVDWTVGVYHSNNLPVRRLELDVLRCPSSPIGGKGYSNYAGVHNDIETPIDIDNNGVFFLNSAIQYQQVIDGSSQTLFIGEKLILIGDLGWMSGTRATLRNTGVSINWTRSMLPWITGQPRGELTPNHAPPEVDENDEAKDRPLDDKRVIDVLIGPLEIVGPTPGPGRSQMPLVKRPKDARLAVGGFASMHPGGAQFAMGDGSVQFLSDTVDPVVFGNLANRADGSTNTSDF